MCFFITLMAVTILNHNVNMSQTRFDHILKQITFWWVIVNVKFTNLVSCWVLNKMTVWFFHIVLYPYYKLCRDFDSFTPQITSCHGFHPMVKISLRLASSRRPYRILWIFQHSLYLAARQPCLCWSWDHWRAFDGQILCFSGKSSSPPGEGEWGTLEEDPRSRQDPE